MTAGRPDVTLKVEFYDPANYLQPLIYFRLAFILNKKITARKKTTKGNDAFYYFSQI